jgi:predicted AlkP superfamily pyrophosphatase or phosphodiesterase
MRRNGWFNALIAVLLMIYPGVAGGQEVYLPPAKPKLVIGIIVEQLRFDQVERFRERFRENGIRKMLNEGTCFQNSSFHYMLTQSATGYATISTGAEPSYHGITSDEWYLPLKDELVSCTKDLSVNPVGGSFESGLHSAINLQVSAFPDELKISTGGKSRVFSVGLKENSAILSAGHAADGVYWYDNTTGSWMSSTYFMNSLPSWVNDFNAMKYPDSFLNGTWTMLGSVDDYAGCLPDSNKFEAGFRGINHFPYDLRLLSSNGKGNKARDYSFLREVPAGNTYTTDFTIKLIGEEKLGKDDVTDYLTVCYNATDNIGHRFGPSSVEMADAILRLDRDIETLLKYLTDSLGKKNVLVFFTSAHGVSEVPAVLESYRIPSGYFRQNQAIQLLRSYLNAVYGEGSWVKGYSGRQVFLNRTLIEDSRLSLEEVQKKVARFLVQITGIASAYPYPVFEANGSGDGNFRRIMNNFSPRRSGDVIVTLNTGWVEKEENQVTSHNSPYGYDSHVPMIWFGWSVDRATVTREVNMTDIAATLSVLCKTAAPNGCTGNPLEELFR